MTLDDVFAGFDNALLGLSFQLRDGLPSSLEESTTRVIEQLIVDSIDNARDGVNDLLAGIKAAEDLESR
jgi:hypothetical protein